MIELLMIPFWIIAMLLSSTVHEYAHALAAYKLGDDTAKAEGRMTLNPLAHIDPIGFFSMIFFRIGWSKPVPVNSYNFDNPTYGHALVALAGPFSNLLLVIINALLLKLFISFSLPIVILQLIITFLTVMLFVNISLMVFNLLPIPPLDGSHILEAMLPKKWQYSWDSMSKYAPFFILLFIIPGSPALALFHTIWYTTVSIVIKLFGLPEILA